MWGFNAERAFEVHGNLPQLEMEGGCVKDEREEIEKKPRSMGSFGITPPSEGIFSSVAMTSIR